MLWDCTWWVNICGNPQKHFGEQTLQGLENVAGKAGKDVTINKDKITSLLLMEEIRLTSW